MLANQLKNIFQAVWQHKELLAIYCFEEYLCDVFLNAQVVRHAAIQNGADYLMLAPYCGLLLIGLFLSYTSRKKQVGSKPKYKVLQTLIGRVQNLQKRFPILMALASMLMVLTGEVIEQELLTSLSLMLQSLHHSMFLLIAFPFANMLILGVVILFCLPILMTLSAFFVWSLYVSNKDLSSRTTQPVCQLFRLVNGFTQYLVIQSNDQLINPNGQVSQVHSEHLWFKSLYRMP